jgi:hypothetical protein
MDEAGFPSPRHGVTRAQRHTGPEPSNDPAERREATFAPTVQAGGRNAQGVGLEWAMRAGKGLLRNLHACARLLE